jgi:endonuclease/exonuclease/phosphatase family metal-dependent hydrolase
MAGRSRAASKTSGPSSTSHRPEPSFHARHPVAQLDRIIVHKDMSIEAAGVHMSAAARRASDHLPIWGEIVRLTRDLPLAGAAGSTSRSPSPRDI